MNYTQRLWRANAYLFSVLGIGTATSTLSVSASANDNEGRHSTVVATPLALSWKFTGNPTSFNRTTPTVVNNRVYFASGGRIYAVNAETGSQLWRFPLDEALPAAISSSPIVNGGEVYFTSGDGKLFALKANTGTIDWQFDTRSSSGNSLVLDNGVVYFGTGNGKIWAIDTQTHDTVGQWKNGIQLSDEVTGPMIVSKGMVFALTLDQVLHGVSQAAGKERWYVHLQGTVLRQTPLHVGEFLYVANGSNLTCVVTQNGSVKWTQFMPTDASAAPITAGDNVYVFGQNRSLYSYDLRTGRPKTTKPAKLDNDVLSKPVVEGNTMFVTATSGGIYALDMEKAAAIKWSYKIMPSTNSLDSIPSSTNVASSPVIADGTMYVLSDDGTLSAFRSDAIDTSGPVISETEPDAGLVINGTPPFHFEAKVVDEGSGLNPDSVRVKIDGKLAPRRPEGPDNDDKPGSWYDLRYSVIQYDILPPTSAATVRPLTDGEHTVSIVASDWRGNTTEKSWTFTIDNSITKRQVRKRDKNSANKQGGGGKGGMSGPASGGGLGGSGKGGN